ncbi:hypothetical protein [Streptomyces griseorubiginosus]|uniref:hypothetical protein n=1 Tax=Streptomyces griseorubiginosus TaxID=67304 RepID=UPI0036E5F744
MSRRKATMVALASVTILLTGSGAAVADGTSPTPSASSGTSGGAGHRLCKRVPHVEQRIEKALDRLNGPVSQKGSIARLQKRVDAAKAAGHTEIEAFLSHRLTHRKSLVPMLQQESKDLKQVTTWCDAHDDGATT